MVDLQDKYQAILVNLLKEDDNKYCTDCDAKGPRWASWNLGFFVCIRCAGIHRNLGVHISKVKSVNLDSWNECQVAMMQMMGNNRARSIYECTMPKTLRRPQTDTTLESFIRNKYEHKIYIGNATIPAMPTQLVIEKPEDRAYRAKNGPKFLEMKKPEPPNAVLLTTTTTVAAANSNNIQLMDPFGFDSDVVCNEPITSNEIISKPSEDLFGDFVSEPVAQVEQQDQPMTHKEKIMSLFNHSSSSPDLQMRGQMMPQYQQQQQLPVRSQVEYAQPTFGIGQAMNYQPQRPQMPVMLGGQNNVPLTNIPARFMTAYQDTMNICKNGTYKPNDVPAANSQYGGPMNGQYPNQYIRPNTYQHPGNAPVFQPMQTMYGAQNTVGPRPTQFVNQFGYPIQAPAQTPAVPDNKAFSGPGAMKVDGSNFNQMINNFNQTSLNDVPQNNVNKGNTFNQDLW